jgi:cysteine synthase
MDVMPELAGMDLPWQDVIDASEAVSSLDSYTASLHLSRQGLLAGPSSGLTYHGLLNFLKKVKADGSLDRFRNADGIVKC